MSGRLWAFALACSSVALLHCGGTVTTVPSGDTTVGSSGQSGKGNGAGTAGAPAQGQSGSSAGSLDAGLAEYDGGACPDAGPPQEVSECDPFAAVSSCLVGQGCYPFVDHPYGDGCGAQSFGTLCARAGAGHQGAACGEVGSRCASGFVCVVGSQPGKHCVQLCRMNVEGSCPRGMICGELDVEGYGVCS